MTVHSVVPEPFYVALLVLFTALGFVLGFVFRELREVYVEDLATRRARRSKPEP